MPQDPSIPQRSGDVDLDAAIEQLRIKKGIPKVLIDRMLQQESGGNDNAVSSKGARSRWQVMPATFAGVNKEVGGSLDPNSPLDNAYVGMKILADNYKRFKPYAKNEQHAWAMAVAGYHGSPDAVEADLKRGGIGIPDQGDGLINTRDHVYNIFNGTKPEDFAEQLQQPSTVPQRKGVTSTVREVGAEAPLEQKPATITRNIPNAPGDAISSPQTGMRISVPLNANDDAESIYMKAFMRSVSALGFDVSNTERIAAEMTKRTMEKNSGHIFHAGTNTPMTDEELAQLKSQPVTAFSFDDPELIQTLTDEVNKNKPVAEKLGAMLGSDLMLPDAKFVGGTLGKAAAGLGDVAAGGLRIGFTPNLIGQILGARDPFKSTEKALHGQGKSLTKGIDESSQYPDLVRGAQNIGAGFIESAPIMLATGGTGAIPTALAFGTQSALQSAGRGESLPQVALQGGKGAATGALLGAEGAEIPAIIRTGGAGLGSFGIEKATGASNAEALQAGLQTAMLRSVGEAKEYVHAQFGKVKESENQAGVQKGKIRVTDEQGSDHVIIKPSTARNQRAIPLREETSNARQSQIQSEAGQTSQTRSAIGGEAGSVPERSASDRLRNGQQAEEAQQVNPEQSNTVVSATDTERLKASANEAWARLQAARGSDNEQQLRKEWSQADRAAESAEARDYFAAGGKYIDATERARIRDKDTPIEEYSANKNAMRMSVARDRVVPAPSEGGASEPQPIETKPNGPPLRETVTHANSIKDAVESGDVESLNRLLDEAGITDADLAVAKGEQYAQQSTTVPARTPAGTTAEQAAQIREGQTLETSSTVPRRDSEAARTDIPDRTGIAQRVEEARRGESVAAGEGISGKDSVNRGRQLLADGRDPQAAVDAFKATGAVSSDAMALVRARHEELAQAANKAFDEGGLHDATFRAAEQARQDWWEHSVKPMQTEWHKTGMAQQGETAIDTGTFYGLYRAFKDATGKEMSPQQEAQARKIASRVADIETKVKAISDLIAAELDKAASLQDLHPDIQTAIKRFVTESQREARAQGRKQARKSLDDEAIAIKSNIAAEFAKLKTQSAAGQFRSQGGLGALDPDGVITKEIIKYAKNRVRAGVTDIAQLVDDVHATLKDFADVSKREIAEAITGIGVPKREQNQSNWMNVKGELRQGMKVEDAAQAINDLRSHLSSGEKVTPEDAKAIWQYAREKYIDRGIDFNDMRTAVATDLGTTPEQVMRAFSDQPTVKRLSDEMYKQMSDRRNARAQAEAWVHTADAPAYQKFISNLPSFFFGLKTFGHGTVGMITHAGKNIFIPSRWAEYWPNFVKQYGLAFDKGYHERMMQDLEANPNFITAKRAGLANDPSRTFDDYQKQSLAKLFGRAGLIGSRGFDSLKLLRQDLFDSAWNKMPDSLKTPEMAKLLAEEMNHSTGVTKTNLPPIASTVFFAPKLEASRWAWVFSDNVKALKTFVEWNRSTPEQQYHAKMVASRSAQFVATYGALLAANQGLLIATGSKDRINMTDPSKGDWLRFKIAGRTVEPTGGLISMVDFLGKIGNAAIGAQNPKEGRGERMGKAAYYYERGKLSPIASAGADVLTQSDYSGRPLPFSSDQSNQKKPRYGWPEYLLTQQTPIPVGEAAKDVYQTMQEQGAPHSYIRAILQGTGVGLFSGGTGVHVGEEYGNRSTVIPPRPKSSVPARP